MNQHLKGKFLSKNGNKLTDDVIVLSFEELQAPQVGAELLKLEGELHVLVRLVTAEQ